MHNYHHPAAVQEELYVLRQRIAELELERVAYQQELSALREEVVRAGEVWFKAFFDNAPVGIGLTDCSGNLIAFNIHGAQQLGYTPEELIHLNILQLTHPDDRATTLDRIQQLLRGDINSYRIEKRFMRKDGEVLWADLSVTAIRDTVGQIEFLAGIVIDITERKQAEIALQRQRQFLRQVIDTTPAIICARDRAGRFTLVNQTLADMYGTTVEALLGKTDTDMQLDASEIAQIRQQDQRVMDTGMDLIIPERRIIDVHGQTHYVSIIKRPLYLADGTADQVLVVATDITTRKLAEEQLHSLNEQLQQHAIRDELTGLYNRRYLNETLPRELQYAARHRQSIGVLMLDIDHFKYINDTYGHDAGDALLRAVGAFLQNNIRSADIACRYGGEEFTLVLVGTALYDTWQRAEDIRTGVKALVVPYQCYVLDTITASVGVAVFPDHSITAEGLLKAADQALYQAKYSGRDRVIVATGVPLKTR